MSTGGDVPDLKIELKLDTADAIAKQAELARSFGRTTSRAEESMRKIAAAQATPAAMAKRAADQQAAAAKSLADKQVREAKRAADAQIKLLGSISAKAVLTEAAIRGIGGGFASLAGFAKSAADSIVQGFADAQKKTHEYATDLLKVKEDLKELATLRGLSTASDEFVRKVAGFGRQTGLNVQQAQEFQAQLYGSSAGGQQKGNIDEPTLERLSVEAAKVASRQTKDFATRGDLIGILSQFKAYKGPGAVAEAIGDAEAIRLGLTEGRGDDAALTKSLLHVAGSLAGEGKMVGGLRELSALIGVTSLSAGPGQADTRSEQLVRGIRGETPEQVKFLKEFAGIQEGEGLETRLDKLIPALRRKRDEGRDISAFLTESGVNAEQVRAITETEGNYEVLKKRFAASRAGASGADIIAESERQAQLDPLQRQKLAEQELAAAKLARGEEKQDVQANLKLAEAKLVAEKRDTSPLESFLDFFRSAGAFGKVTGLDIRVEREARDAARKAAGVEPGFGERNKGPLDFLTALPFTGLLTAAATPFLKEGLDALAGKTGTELVSLQKQSLEELKKQNTLLARSPTGPLGPARPVAPPGP